MEDLNPLDWPAAPFLSLYVMLASGVLLLLWTWHTRLGGRPPDTAGRDLGTLHLAYLAGGADRAAGTALVGLLEAGAAVPDRVRGMLRFDRSAAVATELLPFRHVDGGEAGRAGFQAQFAQQWDRLRDELAGRGLVPDEAQLEWFRAKAVALLSVPLFLGTCKVLVGSWRDRPVGILVVLLVVTGVLGAVVLARRPHRNLAGAAVLAAALRQHERAARAPLPDEMALAFALSGSAVLAGRDYRWALAPNGSSSTGDGGTGDSGGGDGGSGCGGCSS